jgi:hypothetical protein
MIRLRRVFFLNKLLRSASPRLSGAPNGNLLEAVGPKR